jgi:hypothetical protein
MPDFACASCGTLVTDRALFCYKCGKGIVVQAVAEQPVILGTAQLEPIRASPPVATAAPGPPVAEYWVHAVFGSLLVIAGLLLFIAGLGGVGYFWRMDVTVPVPVDTTDVNVKRDKYGRVIVERIHNIGLMDERRNGLLVSMGTVALGAYFMAMGRRR